MKIDVLLGLQWGDEGKGKIVDVITPKYDVVARFQGGPNAGHTLEFNNQKFVLHTIPSGIFRENSLNLIGNGVVIDPITLKKEIETISSHGLQLKQNLYISKKAHLILPTHKLLDAAQESAKGQSKIGSTLKGIGPTYTDKIGRNGLRVGDTLEKDFMDRTNQLVLQHQRMLNALNYESPSIQEMMNEWLDALQFIKQYNVSDGEYLLNHWLQNGKKVLAEGAQGTLLDVDFGSYPYVTSSNTVCAGACTGLGVSPKKIGEVYGIFKAYCTRVGSGPFPTELNDEIGEQIRKKGNEYGSTTGRSRRCGWLDIPALKYAVMINGVTKLIMMKSDVLSGFDQINVCTGYNVDGVSTEELPFRLETRDIKPIYTSFKGWSEDLTHVRNINDMPENFRQYVEFIQQQLGVPIEIVSCGPDREQTVYISKNNSDLN